jgi:hypothetical protein
MRAGTGRILATAGAALLGASCWAVRAEPTTAAAGTTRSGASETLAASLPLRRDGPASGSDSVGWAGSFALLALGGGVVGWLLWRQSGRGRARSAVRGGHTPVLRLSSQALTPQASVHAVQWQGEEYLLGCTAQQVTLLCRRPIHRDGEEAR